MCARLVPLFAVLAFLNGCEGCNSGPATRFCQQALDGIDASPERALENCKSCCTQEVPYKGRLENGRCVCDRP